MAEAFSDEQMKAFRDERYGADHPIGRFKATVKARDATIADQTSVIERMRGAIERLASSKALGSPGVIPDELRLRMIYADMVLESGEPLSAIEKEIEEGEHQRIMANAKRRQALDEGKE